jgi:ABC-type uncharacterized transport system substrate-binding protein
MLAGRKRIVSLSIGVCFVLVICTFILANRGATQTPKFKIGYLEAGSFWLFTGTLDATKAAMDKMGWQDKVEFPKDAQCSPGWAPEKKEELQACAQKLMARDDLALIIAAGTDATTAILKANNGRTPIIAMAVSDPMRSKFVVDENDSGVDNFTVYMEKDRYRRMFKMFHEVVGFKKLGLIYSDTESGRIYSNVDDAQQVAGEQGFQVVEFARVSRAEKTEECLEGIQWLIDQGIDAFFIGSLNCFDWSASDVKKLLDVFTEAKIPTFAREGTKGVKAGALMGFSSTDFAARGNFIADKIVRILQGEKPRSLPMVDATKPKISLNLPVAVKIGFDPPVDLLASSDEILQEITLPEDRLVK